MADVSFIGALELLRRLGFFDIILPTLLVYAVVLGILDRTAVFGYKDETKKLPKKELNSIVAFAIALTFVGAANILGLMTAFIPYIGLLSVMIVSFVMLGAMATGHADTLFAQKYFKEIMLGVTAFAFVFAFGLAAGWWTIQGIADSIHIGGGIFTTENLSVLLFFGIIIAAIFWVMNSSKGGT